ncbi:MAG: FtsW/RodA/SpoVE family cell cycle protein, partial [Patescibacteria group bacterium]
ESTSDTIFAILTEETGFLGALAVIALFLTFLWRGVKIAKESPSIFSQLTALGISSWICLQAFIHIGSAIRALPLTGIPLPFITYGGSHLVAELIGVGILLNISRQKN